MWEKSRLLMISKRLSHDLRHLYPERINTNASELALVIAWGDYPFTKKESKIQYPVKQLAPILQFGSVFKQTNLPIIAMPMPQDNHLDCFHKWVASMKICNHYRPRTSNNPAGLVFAETAQWDDLIPQIVWRGSFTPYLLRLVNSSQQELSRGPDFNVDILPKLNNNTEGGNDANATVINLMRELYDDLSPRWKGVVLTAEAEMDAGKEVPWVNIKFRITPGAKINRLETSKLFLEHGIPVLGEKMSHETLAGYKYHIDLGGAGGEIFS